MSLFAGFVMLLARCVVPHRVCADHPALCPPPVLRWAKVYQGDPLALAVWKKEVAVIAAGQIVRYGHDGRLIKRVRISGGPATQEYVHAWSGLDEVRGFAAAVSIPADRYGEYHAWSLGAYDAAGAMRWTRSGASLLPKGNMEPGAVLLCADGGVLLSVGESAERGQSRRMVLMRFAPDGSLRWSTSRVPAPLTVRGIGLMAERADGSFTVGGTESSAASRGRWYWWVGAVSADGVESWSRTEDGDTLHALAVDGEGRIVLAGGIGGDWRVACYGPDGRTLWSRMHDGAGHGRDEAFGVAVNTRGHVIVVGTEGADAPVEGGMWAVRAYDAAGRDLWQTGYRSSGTEKNAARRVAIDGKGTCYVAGTTHLGSYSGPSVNGQIGRLHAWAPSAGCGR